MSLKSAYSPSDFILPVLAMCGVVAASNVLVQYPFDHFGLGEILTYGAFTYPIAFLVNDLANRTYGPAFARKVVYVGFTIAVILSIWLATPRIAIASGYSISDSPASRHHGLQQAAATHVVEGAIRLRHFGSLLDTLLFFSIAFAATLRLDRCCDWAGRLIARHACAFLRQRNSIVDVARLWRSHGQDGHGSRDARALRRHPRHLCASHLFGQPELQIKISLDDRMIVVRHH